MKIIDPHIHLFDLSLGQYHWLKPENPPFWTDKSVINNNFSEADLNLTPQLNGIELYGFVHIEAGFNNQAPWQEIAWLEQTCKRPFKSVACIDITLSPEEFLKQINTLSQYKSLVGCRHILDDDAVKILSHKNASINLQTLSDKHFIFELQMPLSNTKAITLLSNILSTLPQLTIIIDHAGFPPYLMNDHQNSEFEDWLQGLSKLSVFKYCAVKCSGWEMEKRDYDSSWCNSIIKHCIETFGINRVMLASNFPLCLFSKTYPKTWQHYIELPFSIEQLEQLCFSNAKLWYKV